MKAIEIPIQWHEGLPIYASEAFLKSVGDEYGWIGGIDACGELRCILPYTVISKAFTRLVRFRTAVIPQGDPIGLREERLFLNGVVDHVRNLRADMIIPATTNAIFRTYPEGADAAPYGTYMVDLAPSEDMLFANLNSSHRRKLRLAMKNPAVVIREGLEYLEISYGLIRDTFSRSKLGFMDLRAFRRYVAGLGEHVRILVAFHGNEAQGCLVVPYSQYCAYYAYGGSTKKPATGVTNLLHWEAIKSLRAQGVGYYDFVGIRINPAQGSRQEGLMHYKQRFGGRLVQGYIWKYAINLAKYRLYSLAVRLTRGGDIVDQERQKLPDHANPPLEDSL
jgi:hypothetical protein